MFLHVKNPLVDRLGRFLEKIETEIREEKTEKNRKTDFLKRHFCISVLCDLSETETREV